MNEYYLATGFYDDGIYFVFLVYDLAQVRERDSLKAEQEQMVEEMMLGWANANLNSLRIQNFDYPMTRRRGTLNPEFSLAR